MSAPDQQPAKKGSARRTAKASFQEARAPWREARKRVEEITEKLEAPGLTESDRTALEEELKALKGALPALAESKRSARKAWIEAKEAGGRRGPAG